VEKVWGGNRIGLNFIFQDRREDTFPNVAMTLILDPRPSLTNGGGIRLKNAD
jgi:hypothetical protein